MAPSIEDAEWLKKRKKRRGGEAKIKQLSLAGARELRLCRSKAPNRRIKRRRCNLSCLSLLSFVVANLWSDVDEEWATSPTFSSQFSLIVAIIILPIYFLYTSVCIADKRIIITSRQFWHAEFLSTDEIFMNRSQRERGRELADSARVAPRLIQFRPDFISMYVKK